MRSLGSVVTRLLLGGCLLLSLTSCRRPDPAELARLVNLAKARLENRQGQEALEVLLRASKLSPNSLPVLRNLARARLLLRQYDELLDTCERLSRVQGESAGTHYLTGLALIHLARFEEAAGALEKAVRLDPHTATLRFQLATAYQTLGNHDGAVEQLRETVRLDPLYTSAHYQLGNYARKAGDQDEFAMRQREFLRLRKLFGDETRSAEALERCVYTKPEAMPTPSTNVNPVNPIEVRLVDASKDVFATSADREASAVAVLSIDEQGRYTLVVADLSGNLSTMAMDDSGRFTRSTAAPRSARDEIVSRLIVGDFHDDVPDKQKYDPRIHGLNDVLALRGESVLLYKQTSPGTFANVTEAAGLDGVNASAARWVDVEHDGDLDLALGSATGLRLWQNNGNATFTNVSESLGLIDNNPVRALCTADLEANVGIDLIVAHGDEPTRVFENQRAGRFRRMPEPPGPWPPAMDILADDLNNDGHVDVLFLAENKALVILGGRPDRMSFDFPDWKARAAVLFDHDNDGWLDLCIVGKTGQASARPPLRIWRNNGSLEWLEITQKLVPTDTNALTEELDDVLAADWDGDGDSDLLLLDGQHRLHFLRNDGGHAQQQLKLRLLATKTNPSALGTHVEVRQGVFFLSRTVTTPVIELGLGHRNSVDTVQTVWTNGVVDNQIEVNLETPVLSIVEKNVPTGSCPFLFAWDGTRYRFVTDLLGNSPIGLSLRRGFPLPADPDEFVFVGPRDALPLRDGAYSLEIGDQFREVFYLDYVKLVAVDHPPGVEIHSTDKITPQPFPPSELWALSSPQRLLRAMGSDGIDRTDSLRYLDDRFAPPGPPRPPPYRGMCHPMALTLNFGSIGVSRPLVLALTGWLQYGDASTNIAMSQDASLPILAPTLEAQTAAGTWAKVDVIVGMPAGKTKTILCDLKDKLPAGTSRLRLTTTFEIRWDRIVLFDRDLSHDIVVHDATPSSAELYELGFPELATRSLNHPSTPDHDRILDQPPWRNTPQGWCTKYGDVRPLVVAEDNALVVMNGGDALRLRFDADSFPPSPPGLDRSFFVYAVGWDKDQDHNVLTGDRVLPMPSIKRTNKQASVTDWPWRQRFNRRWVPANRYANDPRSR